MKAGDLGMGSPVVPWWADEIRALAKELADISGEADESTEADIYGRLFTLLDRIAEEE